MALALVAALAAFGIAAVAAASPLADLLAKEGPVEHLSHAVLVVAVVAWGRHAARGDDNAARILRGALALFLLAVLGEELDWGAVYGLVPGRGGNVHNAWGGASYLVFALPLGLIVAAPWVAPLARALGRAAPGRVDALGLLAIPAAALSVALAWPRWEPYFDEYSELLLYGALAWLAIRRSGAAGD